MRLSDKGLQLLKQWEGCKLRVYKDAAGLPTIGVGHLLTREELVGGKYDDGITEAEAMELLAQDVAPAEKAVSGVKVPLTQNQFDALVSFVFNVGTGAFRKSTLLRKLNSGDYAAVPVELRKWTRAAGKRVPGLVNRRDNEILLWKGLQ